jgi:hypothetical protein
VVSRRPTRRERNLKKVNSSNRRLANRFVIRIINIEEWLPGCARAANRQGPGPTGKKRG